MRRAKESECIAAPQVGIAVDGASGYGRGILRGVMRYANLQRRWVLHQGLWRVFNDLSLWPKVDGAIMGGVGSVVMEHIREHCPNVISCSGHTDPKLVPVVALDDEAAGRLAAEHLMNCRLERFAFFGSAGNAVGTRRLEGFRKTLMQQGYSCLELSITWPPEISLVTHTHWPQLIEQVAALPKPMGIMAADDAVANDLAGACQQAGISVPDQVAIIGVNNDDLLCESAWPPISSVVADYTRMGYEAAKILERLLAGETLEPEERLTLLPPLGVAQRASTNLLAVDDPNVAAAVRYIREHACDPCGVKDVLRHVPVNRRWLERQFVMKVGRTPYDEIARVRMETAKRLLLQRDLTLPEIAERCGFATFQNLLRAFRQATGTTPGAYRRKTLRG